MEIKDLEIFKEVAAQQNISRTASKFNYVQSNVTNRLSKLEAEVGCVLLNRTNKGVQLTQEGKLFLVYVDRMLQLHREMIQELAGDMVSGALHVGATDITTASRLPTILKAFINRFPVIDMTVKNGSTEQLIEDVITYTVDGAFITNPVNHPQLAYEPLLVEEVVLISSVNYGEISTLNDVKDEKILVFNEGCTYRQKLEKWIQEEGVFLKKMEFGTVEGMIGCVKAGLGIALVSKHIAQQLNGDGSLLFHHVPEPYRYVEMGFIFRKDASIKNLKAFLHFIKESVVV